MANPAQTVSHHSAKVQPLEKVSEICDAAPARSDEGGRSDPVALLHRNLDLRLRPTREAYWEEVWDIPLDEGYLVARAERAIRTFSKLSGIALMAVALVTVVALIF